jgi:transposase
MTTEESNPPSGQGSDHQTLFDIGSELPLAPASVGGAARVQRPNRLQMRMQMYTLEAMLPDGHQARAVWEYVEGLDLSGLYDSIRAVEGRAGREAIDPRILMALWLYATLDGVGAAREVDRLCQDHVAYQWICGGVSVNYHTLSDFRTDHVELLDKLLTQSVAALMHQGLVTLNRVAQDGMRVRASAGSSSFRRGKTLERLGEEARHQVEALRKELQADPSAASRRQQAARERAGRERQERIKRALTEFPKVEKAKPDKKKDQTRVSTSDPEARVMKMGDGGFRPAMNVQFATDTQTQIITGADVTNAGSDKGLAAPMIDQHKDRYGQPPKEALVDGGFASRQDIDTATNAEPPTIVYAPVQKSRKEQDVRYARQPGDTDAVAQWRQRMSTPLAQQIYKERAATAECVNAIARNRGLQQFLVRGLRKTKAVILWFALAHNLVRAAFLRRQAALAVS